MAAQACPRRRGRAAAPPRPPQREIGARIRSIYHPRWVSVCVLQCHPRAAAASSLSLSLSVYMYVYRGCIYYRSIGKRERESAHMCASRALLIARRSMHARPHIYTHTHTHLRANQSTLRVSISYTSPRASRYIAIYRFFTLAVKIR